MVVSGRPLVLLFELSELQTFSILIYILFDLEFSRNRYPSGYPSLSTLYTLLRKLLHYRFYNLWCPCPVLTGMIHPIRNPLEYSTYRVGDVEWWLFSYYTITIYVFKFSILFISYYQIRVISDLQKKFKITTLCSTYYPKSLCDILNLSREFVTYQTT